MKNKVSEMRSKLAQEESELLSDLNVQSSKFGEVFNHPLTRIALVGAGALATFFIVRSLVRKGKQKKESLQKKTPNERSGNSEFTQQLIAAALKVIVPYAIDKIQSKEPSEKE